MVDTMRPRHVLSREQEMENCERDYHDHNLTELQDIHDVLQEAVANVEASGIPYAIIGGLAVKNFGRPRVTHDIDFFVRPDDAELVLKTLEAKGFSTQLRDPYWLYKAWKKDILVDIIFKSSGDIYFDEEVRSHVRRVPYNDMMINAISPEDFIVIKAAAHQEHNPHHWHDALAVLKQGGLDWDYLLARAKHAPRRVLALLIYGQSNDLAIPNEIIQKLYRSLYEAPAYHQQTIFFPYRQKKELSETRGDQKEHYIYTKGRIMDALTMDERIAEHDIKVIVTDSSVIAKGEVFTREQKEAVDDVLAKCAPSHEIKNQVNVRVLTAPDECEDIR